MKITINTKHNEYNNKYLATFYLNNKIVTRPARLTDLLYCSKCHKVTLPQYAMEYNDPCPFCNNEDELYEFDPYDYNNLDELNDLFYNSGLDLNKFIDADEIIYYFDIERGERWR